MLYLYHYRGGYNNIASLSCQSVFASLTVGVCFFDLHMKMRQSWHAFAFSHFLSIHGIVISKENEFPVSRMDEAEHIDRTGVRF